MNLITPNPLLGVAMHAVGATFAATCYTPEKRVRGWSWQSYWLTQASFCWFLLPLLGAWLTIPELGAVLREAPTSAMLTAFGLGAAYGIGGTAFGISIRHIGFSLTYAVAVGLSSVLGTLLPPLVKGTLGSTLAKPGAGWIVAGIVIGTLGIAGAGWAGRLKERDLSAQQATGQFSLVKGLLLSLLAGVLSAVYGFALESGEPIADVASAHGAGVWRGNVVYIFSNTGAFLTTSIYCLWLHARHKTLGELVELPAGSEKASLPLNWAMAIVTGLFWYGQFFFYNLGHVRMGQYKFTSWAIHMIMLVLISNLVGLVLKEWLRCRRMTHVILAFALLVLTDAVLLLTYGNHAGDTGADFFMLLVLSMVLVLEIVIIVQSSFLLTLQGALNRCSTECRAMAPGLVWLNLIPLFNLVWSFFIVRNISMSLGAEFRKRGITAEERPGQSLGLAMCILLALSNIPFINVLTSIPAAICFIVYWRRIASFSRNLAANSVVTSAIMTP